MSATVWSRWRSTNFAASSPASTNQTGAPGGTSPAAEPSDREPRWTLRPGRSSRARRRTGGLRRSSATARGSGSSRPRPRARSTRRPPRRRRRSWTMDRLEPSVASVPASTQHDEPASSRARVGSVRDHVDRRHVPQDVGDARGPARSSRTRAVRSPGADAEHSTLEVRRRGVGQHDARQVVAGERDRSFERARREHHAPGADVPARRRARPRIARGPRRSRRRKPSAVACVQVRDALGTGSRRGVRLERPVLVDQQDAVAVLGGRTRGRLGRRAPPADDQHLDVRVPVRDPAASRSSRVRGEASDARRGSARRDRRQRHHGRGDDRVEPRLRDLDERVRLLDARREDAAGAAEDRAAERADDPVREQRARERVALEPLGPRRRRT